MKEIKQQMPSANIAINKSRIKVYNKKSDMPTYYLNKGQEFQIELFNPTNDILLAKISLNNKEISQGGLVIKPGQRVFLDRYLDVAKKFKFDTYEVSNTNEVKEAIKDNGDFKVEFYREEEVDYNNLINLQSTIYNGPFQPYNGINTGTFYNTEYSTNSLTNCSVASTDSLNTSNTRSRLKSEKSIETGRVEAGGSSDQKFKTVNYDFEKFSFHTVTYKLLPLSEKVKTVKDIKKYCTECGSKQKQNNKFCPNCGTRV